MSYDTRCLALANVFLEGSIADSSENADRLAQVIQDAIESELNAMERAARE